MSPAWLANAARTDCGLVRQCVDALQDEAVLNAVNDPVMAERVAGIIEAGVITPSEYEIIVHFAKFSRTLGLFTVLGESSRALDYGDIETAKIVFE